MIKKFIIISLFTTAFLYSCNQSSESGNKNQELTVSDSVIMNDPDETLASNDAETNDADAQWNQIDRNSSSVKLPEVSVIGLETRGGKDYKVILWKNLFFLSLCNLWAKPNLNPMLYQQRATSRTAG